MSEPLRALFVDMDSYFASVEQQNRPELRGRPVGVVPVMAESSCCIAASYEAKAFGVRTGTRISEARVMCPGIVFVLAEHGKYIETHHRVVEVVESCIHVERVMSIDEMVCWLPYNWRERAFLLDLGRRIKERMAAEVGEWVRCSIGVGPNGYLAKIASKMEKPNGLTLWEDGRDLPEALFPLPLGELHGIGRNMEARLRGAGIQSVRDLYRAEKKVLRGIWGGVEGERLWHRLRGEVIPVEESRKRTVGHSHVLPPEERVPERAVAVLHRLVQKAATRMRHYGMLAGAMEISLRFVRGERWTEGAVFQECADSLFFSRLTARLWRRRPEGAGLVLQVGVVFFRLVERENYTPSLFSRVDVKRERLNEALDRVTERFGKGALYFGGAHGAVGSAPMRISFTHIPEVKVEE
ncbi:MAG: DNA polymerase Y family protein [Verrucomicrobiales bacterium]